LLVLLAMSLLVFLAIYAIGNPVDLLVDPNADTADRARVMQALGLDLPLWRQYLHFLAGALSGNLGNSFIHGQPAIGLVLSRLPATLELAFFALILALAIGLPLGLWAGARGGWIGHLARSFSLCGFSLPTFWVGLMLILLFAVILGWLPPGGRGPTGLLLGMEFSFLTAEGLRSLILPAATLALFKTALLTRLIQTRSHEALGRDDVRFARSRGVGEGRILGVHILKSLAPTLVTVMAMEFGSVIAFAVVTESIFGWPGMGKLLIDAIGTLDRPVVVAYLLVTTVLFVTLNLTADLLGGLFDPRLRQEAGHD
jgi:peptide/nickel transport system permease protein